MKIKLKPFDNNCNTCDLRHGNGYTSTSIICNNCKKQQNSVNIPINVIKTITLPGILTEHELFNYYLHPCVKEQIITYV